MIGAIDDIKLENVLTDSELITDNRSANTALNGVYASWSHIDVGWFTNHLSFRTRTIRSMGVIGANGFSTNDVKIENSMIARNYAILYRVINMANSVILPLETNAPKDIEESRLKEIIGEARYHRALAHLMMLRQYGEFYDLSSNYGIVTYDEPARDNDPKARSTVAETYDLITKDLEYAAKNTNTDIRPHYYIGQAAAKALLARVMLYQKRFDMASQIAGEVIASAPAQGYALESDYLDIFRKRSLSKEVLFAPYAQYPGENNFMLINSIYLAKSAETIADELVDGAFDLTSGEGMDYRIAKTFSKAHLTAEGNSPYGGNNKYRTSNPHYSSLTKISLNDQSLI